MQKLKVNPVVKRAHYQFYFNVSERTAQRMIDADRKELAAMFGRKMVLFSDFFAMYGDYPCPRFVPAYKVPEKVVL